MSTKKYLSLERLAEYDALLKAKIAQDDAATLDAAKEYADQKFDGHTHSWNELTDKPFGEEYSFGELYRNENLAFVENGSVYASEPIQTSFALEDGKTYRVEWDGTEYTCVCWAAPFEDTKPFIVTNLGNASIAKPDFENTGEPFVMQCMQHADTADEGYSAMAIGTTSTLDTHSVVINGEGSITKAIDEKYIPDTIARKADLDASITNITNGDIVVKEAEHATSADSAITADSATSAESATKATQDGNGAVIADTYETKADAAAKLDEAKEYADGIVDSHVYSWNDLADKPTDVSGGLYIQGPSSTSGVFYGYGLYKVSNAVPTLADFENGCTMVLQSGETKTFKASDISVGMKNGMANVLQTTGSNYFAVFSEDTKHPSGTIFTEGTYFGDFGGIGHTLTTPKKELIKKEMLEIEWNDILNKPVADSELSTTSTNPVQNKVITSKINSLTSLANSAKSTAEQVNSSMGTLPSAYTTVIDYIDAKHNENERWLLALDSSVGDVPEGQTVMGIIENIQENAYDDTALVDRIDTVSSAVELLTNGVDAEAVDGVNDLIAYVNEHGAEVTGMKADIKANADAIAALGDTYASDEELAQAIADEVARANSAYAAKALETTVSEHKADTVAHITAAERTLWNASEKNAKDYADGLNTAMTTKVDGAIDRVSANETAIGDLNTAVAGKVAQGDFNSAVERVAALEAWHEDFEEITAEDINGLFA